MKLNRDRETNRTVRDKNSKTGTRKGAGNRKVEPKDQTGDDE